MQRKLLFSYITIILLAICISGITFWTKGYQFLYTQSKEYYLSQSKMVADIFSEKEFDDMEDYHKFVLYYSNKYDIRITIIDAYGNVYADSSNGGYNENHANREEFVRALKGESVVINRYSKTMGQKYSYSAVPASNGEFSGVMRISLPLAEIKALNNELTDSIIYTVIICFVIAIIAAIFFTKILAKPIIEVSKAATRISKGELDIRIYTRETDQIGRLAGAFNVMTANLKETIDSLTKRNVELEAMLTSISGSVVAINDSNEILFCNKAFLEISHSPNDEINGVSLYNVFRNMTVFQTIDEVRDESIRIVNEGYMNNNINIKVTATPLVSDEGDYFGVLLVIEDITKIKKLENMRSDFVSNVTHELKTPLTSIRGFIDTLKNGAIKDEVVAHRFLDIIDLEAERLFVLIKDILILSEIESKREDTRVAYDLNECIESVIELLETKISNNVEIIFKQVKLKRPFYCNPDRMKQLFINLLDNAIKYTEKGQINITCVDDENEVVIHIKDTGIGIDGEHLERIFERFYRVDRGRSRKQGGTGLGLSIVKHIVELYDGNIKVLSTPNIGTEFIIRFPNN
jgi:two-component system phosphate regulon sensor histidine kinase PhoR